MVFLRNSAVIALLTVVFTLLAAIPGAYAISRLEFFGRRQVSTLFLAVYLFPAILLAVPLFVFFSAVGLRGSRVGLLVVYVAQTVPLSIYMLRNYFETVPVSLEEAAAIDGASRWTIMRRISLPLAMPAVVSNALYVFMIAWNEFLFALLFLAEDRAAVDGVAGAGTARREHRDPDHGADGRVGAAHPADRRAVLPGRAAAGGGADERRREGLTARRMP